MMHDENFIAPAHPEHTIVKPNPSSRLHAGTRPSPETLAANGGAGGSKPPCASGVADFSHDPHDHFNDFDGIGRREPAFTAGLDFDELFRSGGALNPLVQACAPLMQAAAQLRLCTRCPDPAALRDTLARAVRRFESEARARGITHEAVLAARYIVCTLIDESACSTPWGATAWPQYSLLVMFHNEARGGSKVFQLLTCFAEDPARHIDLLELVALTLALGFEGQYRVHANGQHALDALRRRLSDLIRKQRGVPHAELAPHWRPASAPPRRVSDVVPSWLVAAAMALALAAVFVGFDVSINRASDPVFAHIAAIRSLNAPGEPSEPATGAAPFAHAAPAAGAARLAGLLAPDIAAGHISIASRPGRSVITLAGDADFAPGSATLDPSAEALVGRIGEALKVLPGKILVGGHTDSIAIHSARYASNWQLSRERAERVRAVIVTTLDAARVEAQGFGATEPVTGNDTPAGRARNRRVEITLFAQPG
ncbi:type IVB secretion system protein IcmH/DotU [Burkholderia sp. S171]|uniref:type IVB secretion system protein IcmH/DotU n=1 Tax=Burkholderia sp. S171 TaxID=1641860 RepID=UPI00131C4611|nr:type IVB secretion system protein IcmH/DotU [Burkholderia sp. S171]